MKCLYSRLSRIRLPQTGAVYGIIVLVIFYSLCTNQFFTIDNFTNIIRQASVLCTITICSFLAMLTHQVDLSVGALAGLTSVVAALLINSNVPFVLALIIACSVGVAIGLINGFLIAYTKVAPFIITLGTQSIALSVGQVIAGRTIRIESTFFEWLGKGTLWFIPIPAIVAISLYFLFSYILHNRPYGTHLYAVGGSEEAAWASGINVRRIKISVFTINGLLVSIAGFILAARLGSANPSQGMGLELDGICASVLGGTSLMGGRGSIWGALLGALAISILKNGLNMIGLSPAMQMMVIGFILILILSIDVFRRREGK